MSQIVRAIALPLAFVVVLLGSTASAEAQGPRQQVLDLNRQGMEHYNNLEIEQAQEKLGRALTIAERRGVEGTPLARTHLNLGVVAVGGMGDNAAGMQHFESALQADSSIQLDPLTSTPEIQTVFNLARSRVDDGGGGGGGGGGGAAGNIPHEPIPEQLNQTAVPVFVDVPEDAPVDSIYIYYKGLGMRDFRRVEMQRVAGGYGFEIPCTDVFQPKVEYYIVAFGADGSPLGFAGTAEAPIEVNIVGERTMAAPALPGAVPPEQCTDTECPPGMAGCASGGGGGGGMGDTCLSDAECRGGLTCQDNFCVADEDDGGGGGDGAFWGWYEDAPTLFVQLGFSLGLAVVSSGMYSDGEPEDCMGDAECENRNAAYIPEGEGDCVDNADGFQDYCVRVETGGLVGTYAFRMMIGGFVQPWLGLAATMRIQPNSGSGTLAGMLIGGRAILRPFGDLLPYGDLRFHIGTTVGQVQPQPPQNGINEPFIRSGLNGLDFGVSNVFNIMKFVGVYIEADFQILFPISLFNIDLNAGVQFRVLSGDDETLLSLFAEQVGASRYRTALRHESGGVFRSISWEGWDADSDRIAAALVEIGVTLGQPVAIVSRTRAEWPVADVGILKAGAVTVPVYPSLPKRDVAAIIESSGARIAIVEDASQAAKLKGSDVTHVFVIEGGADGDDSGWDALLSRGESALVDGAGDVLAKRREKTIPESLATIVYTSGTVGEPKGVELTHGAFVFEVDAVKKVFPVGVTDLQLLFLPLSHIFARLTLFLQMRIGYTTALSSSIESVAKDFSRIRPTFVIGVPRLYEKLHAHARRSAEGGGDLRRRVFDWAVEVGTKSDAGLLSNVKQRYADRLVFERIRESLGGRIRFMVSGAAPLGPEVAEFFFAAGLPLLTGYGLTETAGAATANLIDDYQIGTVGRALPGVTVAIGEDGEILIAGPNVMRGYHGDARATKRAIDDEGWLRTGDLGVLDDKGFLTITGRKKDLLITAGGKTIAPKKLEMRLEESPFIAHAVVIADRRPFAVALLSLAQEPTRKWAREQGVSGDFLTLLGHPKIDELVTGLVDALNEELASYETIKRWTILDRDLSQATGELTPTHKVRRRAVEKAFRKEIRKLYS